MTQRLSYAYDYGCEREKVNKMNQIENYVSVLIENNKSYADQLNLLRRENTDLRGQIEVLMGETLRSKQNYQRCLAQTKNCYSKQIGGLIQQLKDILNKKEQMEGSYKSLLEQLSYQSEYDRNAHSIEIDELQRNYQSKIKILNDRIQQQNRQLEANFYLSSDSKVKMVKQIDSLLFEIGQLKKQNNDLAQSQSYLKTEISRLSTGAKLACKQREELGVNLLKIQQDKNQTIIELRQSSALLRQQLNDQIDNIKSLQHALIAKQRQCEVFADKCERETRQRSQLEDAYQKISHQLSQKEAQLASLRAECTKLGEGSTRQLRRLSDLVKTLQSDNSRFAREHEELNSQNLQRQQQIYALLERIQKIERQEEIVTRQLAKTQQQRADLQNINDELRNQLDISILEQKKYSEKCMLQTNHMETLERLLQKQKRRNGYLEGAGREAVISNQMVGDYQAEILSLQREKTELISKFETEKQRLIRNYEQALREKQGLFKDKILYLENQILGLSN